MALKRLGGKPLVTAIICSLNGHGRISRAIRSVLVQTYRNMELVVFDDGSSQSLADEVNAIGDDRVRFFRLENNHGLHVARALAVDKAGGEFIALLDDDDYWLPEKIDKQMAVICAQPRTGLVCCAAIDIYPDGTKMTRFPPSRKITYRQELIYECSIASSVLFRRTAYEEVGGFDKRLRRCGDWDCWIRISRIYDIQSIMEPLLVTRMRRNSLQRSDDVESFAQDRLRVLKKNIEALMAEGLWNEALSWHYHSVGARYLNMGQFANARKWLLKSMVKKLHMESLVSFSLAWPLLNRFYPNIRRLGRSYKRIKRIGTSL